jgi:hypothetical protein
LNIDVIKCPLFFNTKDHPTPVEMLEISTPIHPELALFIAASDFSTNVIFIYTKGAD